MGKSKHTELDALKKNLYREYFFDVKKAGVSLAPIYQRYGVKQSNFSVFLKGLDRAITFDVLYKIKKDCDDIQDQLTYAQEKFDCNSEVATK